MHLQRLPALRDLTPEGFQLGQQPDSLLGLSALAKLSALRLPETSICFQMDKSKIAAGHLSSLQVSTSLLLGREFMGPSCFEAELALEQCHFSTLWICHGCTHSLNSHSCFKIDARLQISIEITVL